jgi:hypothetical protein
MCRYDSSLFNARDAEAFVKDLFKPKEEKDIPYEYRPYYSTPLVMEQDIPLLREYILGLFRSFMEAKSDDWTAPILEFLNTMPSENRS